MSAITITDKGASCSICLDDFDPGTPQLSHVGGTQHGFHKDCLKEWLKNHDTCPNCKRIVNANSHLLDRGLNNRLKTAFSNGTIAAFVSFSGSIAMTLGARALTVIATTTENGAYLAGALAMTGAGVGVGMGGRMGEGVMMRSEYWALATSLLLLGQTHKVQPLSGEELAFMFYTLMIGLTGIHKILNSIEATRTARQNIGVGICLSGLAMLPFPSNTPQALALTTLFAGGISAWMAFRRGG